MARNLKRHKEGVQNLSVPSASFPYRSKTNNWIERRKQENFLGAVHSTRQIRNVNREIWNLNISVILFPTFVVEVLWQAEYAEIICKYYKCDKDYNTASRLEAVKETKHKIKTGRKNDDIHRYPRHKGELHFELTLWMRVKLLQESSRDCI